LNDAKPFDAGESYLCEPDGEPSAKWRTVSLITALYRLIGRGPEAMQATTELRSGTIATAAAQLTARGLDAVALVRYGMSQEVVALISSALTFKLILGEDSAIEGVDLQAWCAALGVDLPESPQAKPTVYELVDRFTDVLIPAFSRIKQWVDSASLEDIINLAPPLPGELTITATSSASDRALREQYRWIVDHFAQTFYRDWATSSLHNELKWLDGDIVAPCSGELMDDRIVPRQELVEEIARRAVYGTDTPGPGDSIAAEMTRHAIILLRHGRHREAAAVFEFGVTQRPDDPEIQNNLGFCLIPIDPKVALEHLKAASNMGYPRTTTNSYNQMCCYWALGRPRAALNIASAEWSKLSAAPEPSLLWRPSVQGDWELHEDDPGPSIATLAANIARHEGWPEEEEYWHKKGEPRNYAGNDTRN
jgi:hypothetical protein